MVIDNCLKIFFRVNIQNNVMDNKFYAILSRKPASKRKNNTLQCIFLRLVKKWNSRNIIFKKR